MRRTWQRWLLAVSLIIAHSVSALQAHAQKTPGHVVVTAETGVAGLLDHLVQVGGPDQACPNDAPKSIKLGWMDSVTWACARIENTGQERGVWRIDFASIIGDGFTFWIVRGGEEVQILTAPTKRTMNDLETGGPWLASLPFAILPGETVEIWAKFDPGVGLHAQINKGLPRLIPERHFDDQTSTRLLILGGQLASSLLLIGFFLAFSKLLQSQPARRYAWYFLAATINLIAYDGYLTYLLPSQPVAWVYAVNRIIEVIMVVLYFRFILSFVSDSIGDHRILRVGKWLIRSIPVTVLVAAIIQVATILIVLQDLSEGAESVVGDWLLGISIFVYVSVVLVGWTTLSVWSSVLLIRRRTNGAWLFALGAAILMCAPFYVLIVQMLGNQNSLSTLLVRDLVVLFDALVFAGALLRLTFGLRDQAIQAELAASQEKLSLSESLLRARDDVERARGMAEQHRSRLALTSHDLRQPLTSLRLALEEAGSTSPALRERLGSSLDYLKSILDQILSDTRRGQVPEDDHTAPPVAEAIPLQLVLDNAARMFTSEANAKGVALRVIQSSALVQAQPVELIRMVSNLVSNAINYTDTGTVLLGVRNRGDTYAIEIHDTGTGLTGEEIARIRKDYTRGSASGSAEGEGLGLGSVQRLAAQGHLTLSITSKPGSGSCFAINGLRPA